MGLSVCSGAVMACSFGAMPSILNVLPDKKCVTRTPIATIMDNKPLINILPFGMCSSLLNPAVATATTAAAGVLTPMPCVPVTVAPWASGASTVVIGGSPALNDSSILTCTWGGIIKINFSGQLSISLP